MWEVIVYGGVVGGRWWILWQIVLSGARARVFSCQSAVGKQSDDGSRAGQWTKIKIDFAEPRHTCRGLTLWCFVLCVGFFFVVCFICEDNKQITLNYNFKAVQPLKSCHMGTWWWLWCVILYSTFSSVKVLPYLWGRSDDLTFFFA